MSPQVLACDQDPWNVAGSRGLWLVELALYTRAVAKHANFLVVAESKMPPLPPHPSPNPQLHHKESF
jgi:hypothetical protein